MILVLDKKLPKMKFLKIQKCSYKVLLMASTYAYLHTDKLAQEKHIQSQELMITQVLFQEVFKKCLI